MTDDRTTAVGSRSEALRARRAGGPADVPALVVAWSREEPHRLGEVAFIDGRSVLGRGGPRVDDGAPRIELGRQRPGAFESTGPIDSVRISRLQLRLASTAGGDGISIESVGRSQLLINGAPMPRGEVQPGDTVGLEGELLFVVASRPEEMPALRSFPKDLGFAFGAPDPFGFVGESPAAWRLRDRLAFAARSDAPVLLYGESGTGKELAAAAVHRLSSRAKGPFVGRNAATLPEGLVDAELFGNVKNYPNPGMAERAGLLGEANGGVVFLDELGELDPTLQAHLLRVLDAGGEYQRLGDPKPRRADLRFVAATNRPLVELKHDLAARFVQRIELPALGARREDIPLLARLLANRTAAQHALPTPILDLRLVDRLLRHPWTTHARARARAGALAGDRRRDHRADRSFGRGRGDLGHAEPRLPARRARA
jgi:MoxR-like ATPase